MVWLKQKHPRQLIKLALAHSRPNNLSHAKALVKCCNGPGGSWPPILGRLQPQMAICAGDSEYYDIISVTAFAHSCIQVTPPKKVIKLHNFIM